jgi:hypothetical protein
MPITGPASYVATTELFNAHWKDVDVFKGGSGSVVVEGGETQLDFETLRGDLLAARDAVDEATLNRALARADLQMKKEGLLATLNAFKTKIFAVASASAYARVLPLVPSLLDGQEAFSRPLSQVAKLWLKVNAAPPAGVTAPLVLQDGTTAATYGGAVTALALLYDAVVDAEQEVALALQRRNDLQDRLYELMKKYRLAVPASIPAGNALLDTLPALSPTSGRTPVAVTASGQWNAGTSKAALTATVSADPDLDHYELRACAGADYSTDEESVVASVPPGASVAFATDRFLTQAGEVASFRIYVVLKSGGEAGSNTVVVARP